MTTLKKRSIVIGGRMTSISLEESFWMSLQQIARFRQVTISDLIASLDAARGDMADKLQTRCRLARELGRPRDHSQIACHQPFDHPTIDHRWDRRGERDPPIGDFFRKTKAIDRIECEDQNRDSPLGS
jgi:hypothetical protein